MLHSRHFPMLRLAATVALLIGLPAAPASALTLAEAVDRAIARSPEVQGAASQITLETARSEIAGRSTQLQVGVDAGAGAQYSNLWGRSEAFQLRRDAGGRISQRLWDWSRTANAVEAATLRAHAAELDLALARDRVAFRTAEAYLNAVRAQQALKLLQENITYHRWLVDVAKERVSKNQLAKARLTELQARLAPLEVQRMDIQAELAAASATLAELAGSATDLSMPADLPATAVPTPEPASIASQHPAVTRSDLLVSSADRGIAAARAGYLPALDANLSTRYMADAEGIRGLQWDNQALVRLNWNLFGEAVPAQIKEAEAALAVAEAQRAQARQEVALDVTRYATMLQALKDKHRVLDEYQQVAKFSMEAGLAYIKKTTRFATDMLALADLINTRYQAESQLVTNRVDRQLAELRLLQAAGRLTPTIKQVYSP